MQKNGGFHLLQSSARFIANRSFAILQKRTHKHLNDLKATGFNQMVKQAA
jgi:hypothetical protein